MSQAKLVFPQHHRIPLRLGKQTQLPVVDKPSFRQDGQRSVRKHILPTVFKDVVTKPTKRNLERTKPNQCLHIKPIKPGINRHRHSHLSQIILFIQVLLNGKRFQNLRVRTQPVNQVVRIIHHDLVLHRRQGIMVGANLF